MARVTVIHHPTHHLHSPPTATTHHPPPTTRQPHPGPTTTITHHSPPITHPLPTPIIIPHYSAPNYPPHPFLCSLVSTNHHPLSNHPFIKDHSSNATCHGTHQSPTGHHGILAVTKRPLPTTYQAAPTNYSLSPIWPLTRNHNSLFKHFQPTIELHHYLLNCEHYEVDVDLRTGRVGPCTEERPSQVDAVLCQMFSYKTPRVNQTKFSVQ